MQTSPVGITIRPATPAGLDAMVAVHTQARTAYYRAGGLDDAEICTLSAWERNPRALAFYTRHGWRPDGERTPGPGGADYLRLRLELGPVP